MSGLNIFLAIFPFGLFVLGMFFRKLTLMKVSFIVLVVVSAIQAFYWKILSVYFLNSVVKGFFVAFDIFLIVFGAVFFLEVLKRIGVIRSISYHLESISKDYRIQTILLAWFLINFLEGMAGFGTPGAIVAPVLVSIGLSPLTAVVVSLLGNSSAGVFGAVGTPIRVGFAGLNVAGVPWLAVLFNSVGLLMPVFMIWMLAKEQKEKRKYFVEVLPFALWSGLLFVFCSILSVSLGQEFVSIVGGASAMALAILSLRLGLFVPRKIRSLEKRKEGETVLPLTKVLWPYAVVLAMLVLGKCVLKTVDIYFPWGYQLTFNLFNPGIIFLVVGLPLAILSGRKIVVWETIGIALRRTVDPFLVILAMSTMVQLLVNSGNNSSGLPSILRLVAESLDKRALPFLAPFFGAFGAFVSGSVTISNILFGNILASASNIYNLSLAKLLALQVSGAGVGNTIAIADIMAAEAVVGTKNMTRAVLRRVIGPCLVCLSILGVVGMLVIG